MSHLPSRRSLDREVRAPRAATRTQVSGSLGFEQAPDVDADQAISLYMTNMMVWRCVETIANSISSLPFRVGPNPLSPHTFNTAAPLARRLGPPPYGPNGTTTARKLWQYTVAQWLVTGRWAWEIEYTTQGDVWALWPLQVQFLKPVPSVGGDTYFKGFVYHGVHMRAGQASFVRLKPEQVVYGHTPSLRDWRQAQTVIEPANYDIAVANLQSQYDYSFLRNRQVPDMMVVHEEMATDDDRRAFRDQFAHEFRGVRNAGKPIFVESGTDDDDVLGAEAKKAVEIHMLGQNHKDSLSTERSKQKMEAICLAFGVPMSKLGDASGRTFANAEEEDHMFWTETIHPKLKDLEDVVNMHLAPLLGTDVGWFDTTRVKALQPYKRTALVGVNALVHGGIMTRNEARLEYDLGPVEGGDSLGVEGEIEINVAARDRENPETRALERERREATWTTTDAVITGIEAAWEDRFVELFAEQRAAVHRRLKTKRARQMAETREVDPEVVFERNHWTSRTVTFAADQYRTIAAAAGLAVAAPLGRPFDLRDAYVVQFIKDRSEGLAYQITDTTYRQLRVTLAEGAALGESIPKLAARVDEVFDHATSVRAVAIARTEVISAYSGAQLEVVKNTAADLVGAKEWIATPGSRTRDAHRQADGQRVGVGGTFNVGGENLEYPGDPRGSAQNIVQCRCVIGFITKAELQGEAAA